MLRQTKLPHLRKSDKYKTILKLKQQIIIRLQELFICICLWLCTTVLPIMIQHRTVLIIIPLIIHIGIGTQSTLGGHDIFARKICILPEKYVWKINKMPEFYMFLAGKIIPIPEYLLYLPKKLTKFPNFTGFLSKKCPNFT